MNVRMYVCMYVCMYGDSLHGEGEQVVESLSGHHRLNDSEPVSSSDQKNTISITSDNTHSWHFKLECPDRKELGPASDRKESGPEVVNVHVGTNHDDSHCDPALSDHLATTMSAHTF